MTSSNPSPPSNTPLNSNGIPPFSALPLGKKDPFFSAWGLYGPGDELGALNRLTPARVLAAASSEIRSGVRISTDAPLTVHTKSQKAYFGRAIFHQELLHKAPKIVNDDIWTFNTQVSSQWDGLRHYGYQKEERFYNGVTLEDIHGHGFVKGDKTKDPGTERLGIQAIAQQGIVGRGILLDFHSWRQAQDPPIAYDPFKRDAITLEQLKAVAAAQGTEIKFGDILLIRSGFLAAQNEKSEDELTTVKDNIPHSFGGVEQSEQVLQWIWENFSAVAGDQPSFECWPTKESYAMHEVILSGWGMPIGELFDLEKLAEHCKKENRWSFFLTSEVCKVPGGVASPPNGLAIF